VPGTGFTGPRIDPDRRVKPGVWTFLTDGLYSELHKTSHWMQNCGTFGFYSCGTDDTDFGA